MADNLLLLVIYFDFHSRIKLSGRTNKRWHLAASKARGREQRKAGNTMGVETNLDAAEAELAKAEGELAKAERDIAAAEHDVEKALEEAKEHRPSEVTVIYNGVPKKFEVRVDELVQKLLDEARRAFGPIPQPHLLALFTTAGAELSDSQTIKAAGVKPNEELLFRPSSVRGG
jgi:hypothetical protein